jgi:hypothetical protein
VAVPVKLFAAVNLGAPFTKSHVPLLFVTVETQPPPDTKHGVRGRVLWGFGFKVIGVVVWVFPDAFCAVGLAGALITTDWLALAT